MSRVPEAPTRELYGPSIDALRPVPGRARNGTVGYQNQTLKRQPRVGFSAAVLGQRPQCGALGVHRREHPEHRARETTVFSVPRTRGSPRRRFRNHEFQNECRTGRVRPERRASIHQLIWADLPTGPGGQPQAAGPISGQGCPF